MLIKKMRFMISFILILCLFVPSQSFASNPVIKIIIDGRVLVVDQPPIIQDGRTLVPLRGIFEGLQAVVDYNAKTKVITAHRGSTTVELTLGSKNAKINGKTVQLDVPAQAISGRTVVPVRFIGEAFGDEVQYYSHTRTVEITTKNNGVTDLVARDISDYGDGRDLWLSFTKARNESQIHHYRAIVVKTSKLSTFNINQAVNLSTNRYITLSGGGATLQRAFSSNSLDVDGDLIQNDIAYTVFVASVGNNNSILGYESTNIILTGKLSVKPVSGIRLKDVSDYGDGRDLEISFNKLADEYDLVHYRAIVVRSDEVKTFTLSDALELSSSNYTTISKTGSNLIQTLSSWSRDSKGRLLQSDISYNVFILSVGNQSRSYSSALSTPSSAIILKSNPEDLKVSKLAVKDTFDYGDGRDLQVSFTAPTNDDRLLEYRIFVVREADAKDFTLSRAENTSSAYYTTVSKGSSKDFSINLSSSARDVSGNYIQTNVPYKVFVLSIGGQANSYKNSLSAASPTIRLTNNQIAMPVTNIAVKDLSDWGDGRDLEVSFNKVSDESKVSEYRIMVVKTSRSSSFNLNAANTTSYYTTVQKTGTNLKTVLSSNTRDIYGELIREGVAYNVYVLTVSSGGNYANNALSAPSPTITLSPNAATLAVSNVTARDAANYGDGRDLEVKFPKVKDESGISEYRIMVVKSSDAALFDVRKANQVSSGHYTRVAKTGKDIVTVLDASAKDVNGTLITFDQNYKVFVLSVSSTGNSNALSPESNEFFLSNPQVKEATNVTARDISSNGNGEILEVNFTKPNDDAGISYYDILVVKESEVRNFDLRKANEVPIENRNNVKKTDPIPVILNSNAKDTSGDNIIAGERYRVYILSIADGNIASINALSQSSNRVN